MTLALYNEIDPFAAAWLRALVAQGSVAPGVVDERSVVELAPSDCGGAGQRHFFAGIGGWSRALRLAGVPDSFSVWAGSCPCQPFSSASRGRGGGFTSEKHLWPAWRRLIAECRPPIVLGEQVATGDGPSWFAAVADDLEDDGYAVAAVDLCSSILGFAPRQRLFWAAYADSESERARALDAQMARLPPATGLVADERPDVYGVDAEGDGFSSRMGQRRAYGNAINPEVTALFIRAAVQG